MPNLNFKSMVLMALSGLMLVSGCHTRSDQNPEAGSSPSPTVVNDSTDPSASTTTTDGGVDGGGGEPTKSSKESVINEIQNLKKTYSDLFEDFKGASIARLNETSDIYKIHIKDSKVDSVLRKMQASRIFELGKPKGASGSDPLPAEGALDFNMANRSYEVVRILKKVKFDIREVGPCQHDGRQVPASTSGVPGSDICFSVSLLQSIAPTALKIQLVALLLHELSHQFGADEPSAQKIQSMALIRLSFVPMMKANASILFTTLAMSSPEEPMFASVLNYTELIEGVGVLRMAIVSNNFLSEVKITESLLTNTAFPREQVLTAVLAANDFKFKIKSLAEITPKHIVWSLSDLWNHPGKGYKPKNNIDPTAVPDDSLNSNMILDGYSVIIQHLIIELFKQSDER